MLSDLSTPLEAVSLRALSALHPIFFRMVANPLCYALIHLMPHGLSTANIFME